MDYTLLAAQNGNLTVDYKEIIKNLRLRAEIRRKETCRGAEDRLANQLDEAAASIEELLSEVENLKYDFMEYRNEF